MEKKQPQSNYAQVIAKAWIDPQFKEQLKKDPVTALRSQGIETPREMEITICENTDKQFYLVLPKKPEENLTNEQLEAIAGGGNRYPSEWSDETKAGYDRVKAQYEKDKGNV